MSKFTRACFRKLVAEGLVVGLFATMLTGCGNARAEKWQEDEMSRIIYEEVDCYFISDTISLQETVNCIQSRVSLYMAENFG